MILYFSDTITDVGDQSSGGESSKIEEKDKKAKKDDLLTQRKWYIVHVHSGFEKRAKSSIEEQVKKSKLGGLIGEVLVPQEDVVEMVKGKKKTTKKKFFPGYILVNMVLNNDTWYLIKRCAGVTGFVGNSLNPPAVPEEEIRRITAQIEEGIQKPKPKVVFSQGDKVRVVEGPFANFSGIVEEINLEKGKVRVLVSIFGRSTPIELDFVQVQKD